MYSPVGWFYGVSLRVALAEVRRLPSIPSPIAMCVLPGQKDRLILTVYRLRVAGGLTS
jgi:hypothetical protein